MDDFACRRLQRASDVESGDLFALIDGSLAALVVDGFFPLRSCEKVAAEISRRWTHFRPYAATNLDASVYGHPRIWQVGAKDPYFEEARRWDGVISTLFSDLDCPNPLECVIELLAEHWPAGARIAVDASGRSFFAGDIRAVGEAPVHNDFSPRRERELPLCELNEQLSWNVYFTSPPIGSGHLEVFDRRWNASDQGRRTSREGEIGFSDDIVAGVRSVSIAPAVGRLVLFRTTNFHRVRRCESRFLRISMTSFVGVSNERRPLILWS